MDIKIYTDGGAINNPGPAASAYVIYLGNTIIHKESKKIGVNTNNIAEYTALFLRLKKQ
jgi:ribonuclease HI